MHAARARAVARPVVPYQARVCSGRDRPPLCPVRLLLRPPSFSTLLQEVDIRGAARLPNAHCFLCCLAARVCQEFPAFLPQEHVLCLPSHSGHGRCEIVADKPITQQLARMYPPSVMALAPFGRRWKVIIPVSHRETHYSVAVGANDKTGSTFRNVGE